MPENQDKWEQRLKSGHDFAETTSALQKDIRRGNEENALFWALDIATSGYQRHLWKRLQVIASEDIGLADPQAAILINSMIAGMAVTNKSWQEVRTELIAHAVIYLCRAPKNRCADDASYLISQKKKMDGFTPDIPDYALDVHTERGTERLRKQAQETGKDFEKISNTEWYSVQAQLNHEVPVEGINWTKILYAFLRSKGKMD